MKLKVTSVILTLSALALFLVPTTSSQSLRGLQSTEISGIPAPSADLPISIKINNVANLVQAILDASTFTNSSFNVLTINSFNQGVSDEGVVYSGQVSVTNDQGVTLNGLINGVYNPANGNVVFTAQEIQVDTEGSGPDNSTNSTNENPDNSTVEVPDNSTNSTVENPTENPSNNNTNAVNIPEGFTQISAEAYANNQVAQNALAWGLNNVLSAGIRDKKIPAWPIDYSLTNLILAASRSNNRGVYYLFQTQWANSKNWKLNTNYTVLVKAADQSFSSYGYWYYTYGWPVSAINATAPVVNNSTNTTNNSTNVDNNSTNVNNNSTNSTNSTNVDNNSTNSTNVDNNSTNVDNNSTNSTNSTNVDNNSTVGNNTNPVVNSSNSSNSSAPVVTADGFTVIPVAQLSQYAQASQALVVGYNSLLQLLLAQRGIPQTNTNYTLQTLSFAGYKNRTYGVRYQFTGRWVNEKNWRIDANLTVDYIKYNNTLILNGNSWRSAGYPRGSLNPPSNNNATNSTAPAPFNNGTAVVVTPVVKATEVVVSVDNSTAPIANVVAPEAGTDVIAPVADVAAPIADIAAPVADIAAPVADAAAGAR